MHSFVIFLHLLAAAVWTGGLVFLGIAAGVARATIPERERIEFFRRLGRRFGVVAIVSTVVFAFTGLDLVNDRFGGLGDLSGAPDGDLVIAKTVVFACVIALAAIHSLVLGPRIGRRRRRALEGDAAAMLDVRRLSSISGVTSALMLAGTLAVLVLAADLVS